LPGFRAQYEAAAAAAAVCDTRTPPYQLQPQPYTTFSLNQQDYKWKSEAHVLSSCNKWSSAAVRAEPKVDNESESAEAANHNVWGDAAPHKKAKQTKGGHPPPEVVCVTQVAICAQQW
jgi:hypothetical protein